MKKLGKGQRGFTLLELILVIGLTGIIAAAITGAILGVFNTDARTRNDMTAVYQVRNAGKLVSQDALQAQTVSVTGGSNFFLQLKWTDWATSVTNNVTYTLVDMSGGLKILWRMHYIDSALNSTTKVAEYIDVTIDPGTGKPKTNCSYAGDVVTFTVTATVGGQSETRVYQVTPRPGT